MNTEIPLITVKNGKELNSQQHVIKYMIAPLYSKMLCSH